MVGKTIGHYLIEEKLGEGGMGVVYKARDSRLDRPVAIKVLPHDKVADSERKRRFVQEAKAASALNHPNIVTIYDIDQAEGIDFIAMEYVDGKTLDDVIGRKGLRLAEALKYAIQIADSLTAAHAAGIVHRDLKPGNIMVTAKDHVKVLDFGLAKLMEAFPAGASDPTLTLKPATEEGKIVGTIAYMSPEQAEGKKVDARSDIFSFGSLLYEMVTGRRAFQGESSASTMAAILKDSPKPAGQLVEGIPMEFERLINRCLRKDVNQRFQHIDDVKVALEELKEESDSGAMTAAAASLQMRRRSYLWPAIVFIVVVGLTVAAWLFRRGATRQVAPLEVVPLTSYPGIATSPSFSPDGNQVAFSWNGEREDNYDIYLKLIGSPKPLRLTTDQAWDGSPAFSPDGQSIAFVRIFSDRVAIILIPAIGGTERTLLEFRNSWFYSMSLDLRWFGGTGPILAWLPDGKWIVTAGLSLLSVETGELRKLTFLPTESYGDSDPAVSPDGRTIAFSHGSGGDFDIYLLDLAADLKPKAAPRRLTFLNRYSKNPAWTPDGREIVFASATYFRPTLWRVSTSGSMEPKQLLMTGGEDYYWPAISRHGNRLAFMRKLADINMWRLSFSGSGPEGNPPVRFLYSSRDELNPQYSPDGRRIVFESDRTGIHGIWVSDADGSNAMEVFSQAGRHAGTPRWAPDGQRLVFDSNLEGQFNVYVMNARGGKPVRFTSGSGSNMIASWSSDGNWIYFTSSRSGQPQIWKAPVAGGEAIQVTKNGGTVAFESHDGKYVYFTSKFEDDSGLWKIPVGGGQESQVLPSVFLRNFALMDDGIYFVPRPDAEGVASLQFMDFATHTIKTVAALTGRLSIGLTVSPDRRSAIFSRIDEYGSDLMLVEKFH